MTVTVADPRGATGKRAVWNDTRYEWRSPQVLDLDENPTYRLTADGSTDMASRVSAALTDAASAVTADSGPVQVIFPNGRIRINSTLRIPATGVHIKGRGGLFNTSGTQIVWGGATTDPVFDSAADNYLSNCVVEDLSIEPSSGSAPPSASTGDAFRLYAPTNNCAFRRIHISRLTGDGFDIRPQTLNPSDDTAAANVVFEQIFVSTCGGYGIRTDGYNQFVASMCDFNGNRGGAFHLSNGVSNQACVTIIGQWIESGGSAPSSAPIILDNMANQVVVFIGMTVSGPLASSDVITIQNTTGARPVLIGCNGFGYTNWVNDGVNGESVAFSANTSYFGTVTTLRQAVVRGTQPIIDLFDIDGGTANQRYFRHQIGTTNYQILSRLDDASASRTLLSLAHNSGAVTIDGNLLVTTDNASDIGAAGATRFRDLHLGRNARIAGNLGVGNSASATTLGTVTKKIEVFDASGSSLGFVPVYDAIT